MMSWSSWRSTANEGLASVSDAYRIADEPRPGALGHMVVNPVWPLFAVMFGGVWCAWPWFVLNGFALGSPTRVREAIVAAGGLLGVAALLILIFLAHGAGIIPETKLKYAFVLVIVAKLAISYWLYELQARSFGLYEYFGGQVKNGLLIVIAAAFLKGKIFGGSTLLIVALLLG